MKNNIKNIIILGGSGRIGSEVAKNLSLKGHQIYVIDKIKNKYLDKDRSILCDISNINNFDRKLNLLLKKIKFVDVIINISYLKNKSWGTNFLKIEI